MERVKVDEELTRIAEKYAAEANRENERRWQKIRDSVCPPSLFEGPLLEIEEPELCSCEDCSHREDCWERL